MSPESLAGIGGGVIVLVTLIIVIIKKLPKRVRANHYTKKWREIQKMCGNKEDWAHAIIHADMLLDEILIKKKIVGKTMGERMVAAQHRFSSNDAIWNAHKFANSLRQNAEQRLTQAKIKDALVAYRQALRDLGAL